MSYLLEALGRGLLADLRSAFDIQLPRLEEDEAEALQARCAQSPKSADLHMRLGRTCLEEARLRDAQQAFEKAADLAPMSAKPLIGLACVADEFGQLDQAIKHLEGAQARDGQDPTITFAMAFAHERAGRPVEAVEHYAAALALCPSLRNAYERLAAIAIRDGGWADAIEHYEKLARLDPGDLDTLLILGNLYLQAERPAEAIEQYQRALFLEPECDSSLPAAEKLVSDGQVDEAISTLEKLVRKYPGVAPFHVHLGDLYVKTGADQLAVQQYAAALETQPNFLEATVKLGTQHMRQGRLVDAALNFNRAVELNDRLMTAFVGLGVAQHACGRQSESLATFDLAASLEPSTTLLFSETTRMHLETERRTQRMAVEPEIDADTLLTEALRRHEQALAQHPQHADLHYRYGLLLKQLGRTGDAIDAFRNAVEINPSYSKALVKLAISLKECGVVDEAIEMFQRALRLDDRYVDVHYQLGLLFAQRNQFDLATEQFEQALASDNADVAFRANLALALQNIGMIDRAAAAWRSVCELAPAEADPLVTREHILKNCNS
jgi:tetratricopeptide (TPR) repeat protein